MMKRVCTFICSFLLAIGLLSTAVKADDTYGGITITAGQEGTDYSYNDNTLTILSSTPLTISGNEPEFHIVVAVENANLTLQDASISSSTYSAIALQSDASLTLTVVGENELNGGAYCAGINVPDGTTLTINGSGKISAKGGQFAAGIGGNALRNYAASSDYDGNLYGENAGHIKIVGAVVNAAGGLYGAGIGGGSGTYGGNGGNGGVIEIEDPAIVTAVAGANDIHMYLGEIGGAAGIGGGGSCTLGGTGGTIRIKGGTVNAGTVSQETGVSSGAAIGGGYKASAGTIEISGGTVIANAQGGAPGIGCGNEIESNDFGIITITGGNVSSQGGKGAAGIGAGRQSKESGSITVQISGGSVTAIGGGAFLHPTRGEFFGGAGIGGGYRGGGSDVTISGGFVTAIGGNGYLNDWSNIPGVAIGAGPENHGTHKFSTGTDGTAVIIAKVDGSAENGFIRDQSNEASWKGIIFQDTDGQVYGDQTLNEDLTVEDDQTLVIPANIVYSIAETVTVTNNGTIENNGKSTNNGIISGSGTIVCNNHNWLEATVDDPKTCAFCKKSEGEHLPWVFGFTATPETLDFATALIGYDQPMAQTVTLTNTGNRTITVALPTLTNYTIRANTGFSGNCAELLPNASATFDIQPNASLPCGVYNGTVEIVADNDLSASVNVTFEVAENVYTITKGAHGKWTKGFSQPLEFTADVDYGKFVSVSIDGTEISDKNYSSYSGSTIVSLHADYLKTLKVGNHILRVNFSDGYAETDFTIQANSNYGKASVPQTADIGE